MGNHALLIIDVQKAFNDKSFGNRNNLNAERNMETILNKARQKNWPIIHIQHVSDDSTSLFYNKGNTVLFKKETTPLPDEPIFQKKVNNAFIGTELEVYLQAKKITSLVIIGLTTPHCVSTATRMSGNLGYNTCLISDATAAFDLYDEKNNLIDAHIIHNISLATLHNEFANVLTTNELLNDMTTMKPSSILL
ncbi:cysteine hydrolase family protein [Vagococcus intermedius]|uniref:Cysteine hydrolase n=1 Tax=Vagococcus intermedius TaxID=2991418 RepID=A0AAF0I8H6_9ENTE|nr:cysteine hydrolase family protein [Vagococcus intermedius]WEG73966.1 cysteine hydrolase [Vagococcus intermedius]WEG76046.1 cysteine hydrolase [Vagococcus intermedius]